MTSTIKVNNVQNQCGANIINESSNTITIGASGDTVTLASGASQTGFGREGSVDWQTSSIKTAATFTAASGEGYFVDTSSNAITANLPAGSAGAIVAFSDYARNFNTNKLTISPNGSEKIGGTAGNLELTVNGQALTLVYVDGTQGWINVQNAEDTEVAANFITATGGTITTVDTNFKVHTFTGPGTFQVTAGGGPLAVVDYMVIGGGGGGAGSTSSGSGGGGAGGYRESHCATTSGPYTAAPIASSTSIPTPIASYPITVGAGGAGPPGPTPVNGNKGSNSVAALTTTITSTGGGGGAVSSGCAPADSSGGSGGGSFGSNPAGAGNTPPVTPSQGNPGGTGHNSPHYSSGGGGGATAAGQNGTNPSGGNGGAGATTSINGTPTGRAGGAGGGIVSSGGGTPGMPAGCGQDGGGNGGGPGGPNLATAGTANTGGGGGGGGGYPTPVAGMTGGSGIVIIRYKFQ